MASGTDKLKILLLSSSSPSDYSPRMVLDMARAIKAGGHDIDLLLKYPIKDKSVNTLAVLPERYTVRETLAYQIRRYVTKIRRKLKWDKTIPDFNYYFNNNFSNDEGKPSVDPALILRQIKTQYDLVLVFFWKDMITAKTLQAIYDKLQAPIFLIVADMFPMTGGCSYFWDCRNFETGCGNCPAIGSVNKNDFTHKAFLYKQQVYKNINSVFLGNSWMHSHAKKSKLFKHIDTIYPVINEDLFKPHNKRELKMAHGLNGKTVLFIGSVHVTEERKGFKYLVDALHILHQSAPQLKDDIVLVIAGLSSVDLQSFFDFKVIQTGSLPYDKLAEYYAMVDVYLSGSIQDAGPMMINQALMCGTPVVAFNIGTACDLINDNTGYLAQYLDVNDFSEGILKLINLSDEEKKAMSAQCRQVALNTSSYKAFENQITKVYNKLSNN
ncbi:MAG: glycosyltransferase [Sphingobacteriaceae bacterium]|nr:MAG: glycosyltransferase [Sphingobacteriaceae bacterium]